MSALRRFLFPFRLARSRLGASAVLSRLTDVFYSN